jgi:hypothetical protein
MYAKFQSKAVILMHAPRLGLEDMPKDAICIKSDGPRWPVPRKKKGRKGGAE